MKTFTAIKSTNLELKSLVERIILPVSKLTGVFKTDIFEIQDCWFDKIAKLIKIQFHANSFGYRLNIAWNFMVTIWTMFDYRVINIHRNLMTLYKIFRRRKKKNCRASVWKEKTAKEVWKDEEGRKSIIKRKRKRIETLEYLEHKLWERRFFLICSILSLTQ